MFNFIFYLGQMFTLLLLSASIFGVSSILNNHGENSNIPPSPLFVSFRFYQIGWATCFLLQGIFVIRGLTCDKASVHYKNCLMLKIKLNFMILCALLTSSFLCIALLVSSLSYSSVGFQAFVLIPNFIILKSKFYIINFIQFQYKGFYMAKLNIRMMVENQLV